MSTYSPSLRIELITTGTQAGTWGNTTNTNLGGLIESAIAGYISVSITSANQALTALNGAPDESRNQTIALTTTTAAVFNVYAPPAEKTYVIYNASAYTATIFNSTVLGNTTAAGLGVAIPAGRTVTVWSDGTNFSFQNDHLSSLTLASPLAATSGGTGLTGLGAGVATFLGTPSSANLAAAVTGETGSGALVFATSPTLVTPALGTPSSVVLTNATGLPNAGLVNSAVTINGNSVSLGGSTTVTAVNPNALTIGTGLSGTSYNGASAVTVAIDSTVATLSGIQTLTNKTLTSPTLTTPALGTPASGVMTNVTGLPVATGISGLGTNVATFLATPSSANLAAAVTDETGSGSLVFATSPTLVTPALGTPSSATLTNATGLPIVAGTTGTLSVARGGTGVTASTGSGNVVLSTSPTLVTPALGTPSSATLTNATGLPIDGGTTGTLPVTRGGTGATSFTSGALLKGSGTSAVAVASAADIVGQIGATAVTNATNATNATTAAACTGNSATATKLTTASGSAPSYSARAWVLFSGVTNSIRGAGNVNSITDNGTGDYTVNFATAMPDSDYCVSATASRDPTDTVAVALNPDDGSFLSSSVRLVSRANATPVERQNYSVAIFR